MSPSGSISPSASASASESPSPSQWIELGEGKERGLYDKEFEDSWDGRPHQRKPLHEGRPSSLHDQFERGTLIDYFGDMDPGG